MITDNAGHEALGPVLRVFKPKPANIAAGYIIGLGLIIGPIAWGAALFANRPPAAHDLTAISVVLLIPLAIVVGGIWMMVWMTRLIGHQVVIYQRGFRYGSAKKGRECAWSEVAEIHEIFTQEELKVLKVPGGTIRQTVRSFEVQLKNGDRFGFDVNSIDGVLMLGEYLRAARAEHQIPWKEVAR